MKNDMLELYGLGMNMSRIYPCSVKKAVVARFGLDRHAARVV